ncbi:MAG: hypothetical protein HZC43_12870 [Nitrosomonadales bacterium]|nr:hypothetical protein [Nitrosomonadales bacterium]
MNLLPPRDRMRQLAPLALLLASTVATAAVYMQALGYPFISDDIMYITNNARLAGLRWTELWLLLVEPYNRAAEFLPVRDFSYWMDMTLFGHNPAAFRLHNIFLYLLCLPFVYGITLDIWRYFRPADAANAPWVAAVATSLFALHPAHAEAVVCVAGRKDVLSGLLSLLALWLALRARRAHGLSAPYAAATLVVLLAAMYSKATAVAVAAAVAVLWVMIWRDAPGGNRHRPTLWWAIASLLLAACVAITFAAITTQRMPFHIGAEAVTRALAVLGWLARLSISPESRHYFYPVLEDPWLPAMVALGTAILAASGWGTLMLLRKRSLEWFAIAFFLLLCMPSLQLVPYRPPSLVSDRFLFLAVWMAVLLLAALSWRLSRFPRSALLLVIALAWGFQSAERTRDWRDAGAMVGADLRAYPWHYTPAFYTIINKVSNGLHREASEIANRITSPEIRNAIIRLIRTDQIVHDSSAATGKPHEAMDLLVNLCRALNQPPTQAKWDPAMLFVWRKIQEILGDEWRVLAGNFPGDALVRYNAGLYLFDILRHKDAAVHLRAATESQRIPESERGAAFKKLGQALLLNGQIPGAETALRTALEQTPPDTEAYCILSAVYKQKGLLEEAARAKASCPNHISNEETVL